VVAAFALVAVGTALVRRYRRGRSPAAGHQPS
jgi:hypothetical protein